MLRFANYVKSTKKYLGYILTKNEWIIVKKIRYDKLKQKY